MISLAITIFNFFDYKWFLKKQDDRYTYYIGLYFIYNTYKKDLNSIFQYDFYESTKIFGENV